MRAIVIATGEGPGVAPLDERYPVPLLPLIDRPFLQHVVEYLVAQGITRFDFVLSHLPEKIEHFLGDGTRWGIQLTYHLARDPLRPYRLLKALKYDDADGGPLLLAHADRLPPLSLKELRGEPGLTTPLLFTWRNADALGTDTMQWTGWALIEPRHLATLRATADEKDLYDHLQTLTPTAREVGLPLSVETIRSILMANHAVLDKEFDGLLVGGREIEPGIWLSRNVILHPTARIQPPVYIAEDCQIGPGTVLGPHAVVGKGSILDGHSTVTNTIIFPGSYVGEGLELADVLVDKNRLLNAELGGAMLVEDFILGSLASPRPVDWLMRQAGRLLALSVLLLATPVLIVMTLARALRGQPVMTGRTVVRLPAASLAANEWETYTLSRFQGEPPPVAGSFRDFWLRFLPGLWHVVRGELSYVGVPPRTPEEVKSLPRDWQSVYLRAKAGLVTESMICYGPQATEDEQYAADGFYAVTAGWRHDLSLLTRYLTRVWFRPTSRLFVTEEPTPEASEV